jgi:Ca2+/Na+ antiporter
VEPKREIFKADRNQLIALIAMLCAFFLFAMGELAFGAALFVVAAAFSLGGLFWNAHRQDQSDAEELKNEKQETKTSAAPAANKD